MNEPRSEKTLDFDTAPVRRQDTVHSSPEIINIEEELAKHEAAVAHLEALLTKIEQQSNNPEIIKKIQAGIRKVIFKDHTTLTSYQFLTAQEYFSTRARFDRFGMRVTNLNIPERQHQQQLRERLEKVKARLEVLIPVPKVEYEDELQPTLFHATIADQWNHSMAEIPPAERERAIFDNFPHDGGSWEDSSPIDYMIFRLSVVGVADYDEPLTAQDIAYELKGYSDFLKNDEVLLPILHEVFDDMNALLGRMGLPPLELSLNKVFFMTWERYQKIFEPKHGELGGYNDFIDAIYMPVNTHFDETIVHSKEFLYGLVQHEVVHMARKKYMRSTPLVEDFEEGLVNLIAQTLQAKRGYLVEESLPTYPLQTKLMATVLAPHTSPEGVLLLEEGIFKAALQAKYGATMGEGSVYEKLLQDMETVTEIGQEVSKDTQRAIAKVENHLNTMEKTWGVDLDKIIQMLKLHLKMLANASRN
jgi:hypothetical protein